MYFMKIEKLDNGKLKISGIEFHGGGKCVYITDLGGRKFGRLTVLTPIAPDYTKKWGDNRRWKWRCVCDCGNIIEVYANNLGRNHSTSCGCYNREQMTKSVTKHGLGHTVEYQRWFAMISRCHNKNHKAYNHYKSRKRTVCERWRNSFESFLEDVGLMPDGLTLERGDNNQGYHCGKCEECLKNKWGRNGHWDSWAAQCRNRENNRYFEYNGERLVAHDWAAKYGLDKDVIRNRLFNGWSVEKAINTPIKKRNKYAIFERGY